MDDYYDEWNKVKRELSESPFQPPDFKEREIWWISAGQNIGTEVYGKGPRFSRPVIILKKFGWDLFLGVPLSSKVKDKEYYVNVVVEGQVESALLSQIRVYSSRRMMNRLNMINEEDYLRIIEEITTYLKTASPD